MSPTEREINRYVRYGNWTMVRETIPCAVTSNSVSRRVIWAELSKVSIQPQLLIRPIPAALAKASDYENVFSLFHEFKEENLKAPGVSVQCEMWGGGPLRVLILRSTTFLCRNEPENCENLTEKPSNFIGLLLLDLLIIQSFKEDVQDQYIFSGERTDKSTPKRVYFGRFHITSNDISQFLCNYLSLLLHWRWTMETQVMLCHSTSIHQQKNEKRLRSE